MSSVGLLATASLKAEVFRTPKGEAPMVHWAILESTPGQMKQMQQFAVQHVAPEVKKEAGTYALYGGVSEKEPDTLRLLEIYEDQRAYELHVGSEAFQRYRQARQPILKSLTIVEVEPIAMQQCQDGVGTRLVIRRFEVDLEKIEEYRALIRAQARRAVRENEALGVFITAEKDAPNVWRTLEIYKDEQAYQVALASKSAKIFRTQAQGFEKKELERIDIEKAYVPLSTKGKRSGDDVSAE
ncbi:MAG: antibiotic biosynthesis monooxygenase [Planctomycetia bacterium]|nr:antibiotic biosynthesis monooxygenase [Planctomycetia bacterium]